MAIATRVVVRSHSPMCTIAPTSLPTVFVDAGEYAVASLITPATICTAIPVVKPVITAAETYAITEPSRSRPIASITTPTSTVRVAIAPMSSLFRPAEASTLCEVSAIAEVSVVTISTVRAKTEPRIVGTTPDHSPSGAAKPPIDA